MKKRIILLCGFLLTVPLFAAKMPVPVKAAIPEGPKIRVLLSKDVSSSLLEVRGGFTVLNKESGEELTSGRSGKRFVVHALQNGLRWGEEYPDVYEISVIPKNADSHLYIDGIQYSGSVSVFHVLDNRVTVVNEVAIEDYLKSVLALKFESPLSSEAMEALAIAARTEAYSRVLNGSRPWDVVAGDVDYFGQGVTRQENGVDEAIERTRFMIVESTRDGKPMQNARLVPARAEELALEGLDAQKILRNLFPQTKIGVTINPSEVAIR